MSRRQQAQSGKWKTANIIKDAFVRNALVVHAAFRESTNLFLHIPSIGHATGCTIPTAEEWIRINQQPLRLVNVLPNDSDYHPTIRAYLAGGDQK